MKKEVFDKIVEERLEAITKTLLSKGHEYQRNSDVFHNFEVGARISNSTREKVMWGFALKHYVSFLDMLEDVSSNNLPTEEYVDEKINDLICYLILEEASIKEKIRIKNIITVQDNNYGI